MERKVSFYSAGLRLAGIVRVPVDYKKGEKRAAIVLCHGFTGIKEWLIPPYAEAFTRAGYVTLTFDYRGFGESEGIRGRLIPMEQSEDIRNAITFIETLDEVDENRIGLWGTSFGGANAVYTAGIDPRPKCVVSQVGFGDGERTAKAYYSDFVNVLTDSIEQDRRRRVLTGENFYIKQTDVLSDPESVAAITRYIKELPRFETALPLEFAENQMIYKPENVVHLISPRALLLIQAEKDPIIPLGEARSLYEKAGEPKKLVTLEGVTHFQIYEGKGFEKSSRLALDWYKIYL
ncbi:MAG: alpha/beta fold hydrolase [Candidatus Freyarchaeum deiterrae]